MLGTEGMGPGDPLLTHTSIKIIFQAGNLIKTSYGKFCGVKFQLCWPQPLPVAAPPALCPGEEPQPCPCPAGVGTDPADGPRAP